MSGGRHALETAVWEGGDAPFDLRLMRALFTTHAGRYYGAIGITSSNATLTLNLLYLVPVMVDQPITIDRLGARVTSGGASGALLRFGLYLPNADFSEASLVAGTEDTAGAESPGGVEIVVSAAVEPPLVYVGMVQQGEVCTVERFVSPFALPHSSKSILASATVAFATSSGVSAALPATVATTGSTSTAPYAMYRRV